MAAGIEVFREHFKDYGDQYVVIGGMACDLLLNDAGLDFRITKDIDMVLIVEAMTEEFAAAFWKFIGNGGYKARQRSTGKHEFYRFIEPTEAGYPSMIELFARPENNIRLNYQGDLVPLHVSDELSSLSAILLNEAYYDFLLSGRTTAGKVSVLDALHLVPMKMKAWLDLMDRKSRGEHVNTRDIKKHRQDIFRLFPLIDADTRLGVPSEVYDDIQTFLLSVESQSFDPKVIGLDLNKDFVLGVYRTIYLKNE
jgi:hypothetical protein